MEKRIKLERELTKVEEEVDSKHSFSATTNKGRESSLERNLLQDADNSLDENLLQEINNSHENLDENLLQDADVDNSLDKNLLQEINNPISCKRQK